MKKIVFSVLIFCLNIFSQSAPNVIMEDVDGKFYSNLHDLLDKGHYVAFYMLSST